MTTSSKLRQSCHIVRFAVVDGARVCLVQGSTESVLASRAWTLDASKTGTASAMGCAASLRAVPAAVSTSVV